MLGKIFNHFVAKPTSIRIYPVEASLPGSAEKTPLSFEETLMFRRYLKNINRWLNSKPVRNPSMPKARLQCEGLEGRELMAASLIASLNNGLLRVEGTEGNDNIIVRQD